MSARDPIEQFKEAIAAAGLVVPDAIEADGALHRFSSNGKSRDDSGWYVLHSDGVPAGSFGDWRSGLTESWRADIGRNLTPSEEAAQRAKVEAMRRAREAEDAKRKSEAREKAALLWAEAQPAKDHPYLAKKGIKANGAKLYKDALLIPMRDGAALHSLQFIGADGGKKFLTGGRVAGCYFSIGKPTGAPALCITEGFATGATIHEATGLPVAVAFNAGNLEPVAKALRAKLPDMPLILCADDDARTEGNPGLTKAKAAALAVGGVVAVPVFGSDRPDGATDFNDMARLANAEAVRRVVFESCDLAETANDEDVTDQADTQPQPRDDAESPAPAGLIPDNAERPCFRVFDDWHESGGAKCRPGLWHFGADKEGNPTQTWACSPLHIEAVTFDGQDNNFGRLLRFKTTLGKWRRWSMPMDLLAGDGASLRAELLGMGVEIDPAMKARNLLASYLQAKPPKRRINCALQVGWCGDSFVLPDTVIGPKAAGVIYQSGERGHDEHTQAGTLAGWQSGIAALAVGNPLLLLALSGSFAGPMLARCNAESGGIHYVGNSSTGKTTAIEAACATWGGAGFRRSWRSTANGMEGAAALFNDCLLALDEISECDPREVGAIVYALGNGRGKQRAGRSGNARAVTRWRCFVLSSGERTIGTTMQEGGQRAKAGQAVRLLDIPASRTYGAWDNLHSYKSGPAMSDAIKRAAITHHGHAGRAFLERLTRDSTDYAAMLEEIKALPLFDVADGEGQHKRAAARFALIGMAGELATSYGITGWPEGEALEAAAECFKAWQATRTKGSDEQRQILERVASFIERHGDGRFSDADATGDSSVKDRAGWWRDELGARSYLLTAEGMKEALKGFDLKPALDILESAGALPKPDADGKRAKAVRIGGRQVRLYAINTEKLGGDHA